MAGASAADGEDVGAGCVFEGYGCAHLFALFGDGREREEEEGGGGGGGF